MNIENGYTLNQKLDNTIRNSSASFLFLFAAFPFLSPVNLGFDTQPYCLIFSVFLSFFAIAKSKKIEVTKEVFALLIMLLFASFMFLISPSKAVAVRSLAGYATLLFVTYASYKHSKYLKLKWFNFSVYAWFSVGFIQTLFDKYFGRSLLPRMDTSDTRGITSLAVEPSIAAIVCVFLLLINDLLRVLEIQSKKKHMLVTFLLLLLTAFTFSGMGFLFIFVYLMSKVVAIIVRQGLIKYLSKILVISFILFAVFISFLTVDKLQYSRAGELIQLALISPKDLLVSDVSLALRVSHVLLPIYSLSYSDGLGLGLGTFSLHSHELMHYAGGFTEVLSQYITTDNRIMSGWGTAIYELGIFGITYLIVFLRVIMVGIKKKNKLSSVYISIGITITFIMALAIPLAFPLFSYLLGMCMYYNNYLNPKTIK